MKITTITSIVLLVLIVGNARSDELNSGLRLGDLATPFEVKDVTGPNQTASLLAAGQGRTAQLRASGTKEVGTDADWPNYSANPFAFPVLGEPVKEQLFVVDLNGDGLLDYTFRSKSALYAYSHNGLLLWQTAIDNPREDSEGSHNGGGHGAADVDGDGRVEIVALNRSNELLVYDGSSGTLERRKRLPSIGSQNKWTYIAVANLRGEGDRDLILGTMDTTFKHPEDHTNRNLLAWDMENDRELWRVVQDNKLSNGKYEGYFGPGHGGFRCADVDGDGLDEVVGGNMIDHDGKVVDLGYPRGWIRRYGHLDALAIGDYRPDLPGLEWVVTEESGSFNTAMLSASGVIWRRETSLFPAGKPREPQNVAIGNFDPKRPHSEVWNRSRFKNDQRPWVYDALGTKEIAHYAMRRVLPPGFNTHKDGNGTGLEIISAIDWVGGPKEYLAAKARHVAGNIGIFDAMTGAAVWYTPRDSAATQATVIYAVDVAGDWREEVVIYDAADKKLKVYWNEEHNPHPPKARKWTRPHYRRVKQNWNYYSP